MRCWDDQQRKVVGAGPFRDRRRRRGLRRHLLEEPREQRALVVHPDPDLAGAREEGIRGPLPGSPRSLERQGPVGGGIHRLLHAAARAGRHPDRPLPVPARALDRDHEGERLLLRRGQEPLAPARRGHGPLRLRIGTPKPVAPNPGLPAAHQIFRQSTWSSTRMSRMSPSTSVSFAIEFWPRYFSKLAFPSVTVSFPVLRTTRNSISAPIPSFLPRLMTKNPRLTST